MGAYQIQKDGSEYRVSDREALVQLIHLGRVQQSDRLRREGEKRFRAASSFKELKEAFEADEWEAWDALGDVDPATFWEESTEWIGGKEPAPAAPAAVDSTELSNEPDIEPYEEPALQDIQEDEDLSEPEVEPESPVLSPAPIELEEQDEDSNVIVFPTPPSSPSRMPRSNAQPMPLQSFEPPEVPLGRGDPAVRRPSPPKQFRAFPWVFGSIAFLGGGLLLLVNGHIQATANWTSPGPEGPPPEQVLAEAERFEPALPPVDANLESPRTEEPVIDEAELLFQRKTEDLRDRMSRGVTETQGQPDDLTNALMIEMSRMRVGLLRLKAPVHAWGGSQNDLPQVADVHIVMKAGDDLIEQLGAAVLVVGKYLHAYEMELTGFVVGLQDSSGIVQEREISADGARSVFNNRMSMRELLME